jgi:uncharacterized protein (TIGR00255 family)
MTGFGRASVETGDKRLRIEIRSVNHRGLDLKIRSHVPDSYCDSEIARAVRAAVERGALTVSIHEESGSAPSGIDEGRVRAAFTTLERLRRELKLYAPVELATVAAFIGSATAGHEVSGEALWEALRPGIEKALQELRATRTREGQALAVDFRARIEQLQRLTKAIEVAAAGLPQRFARRLEERLQSIRDQPGFEPGRLAQEAALMAERLDVSEELVRLGTHLGHLREIVDAEGPLGRKLDFVIQEVGREINTIGSKAQDAGVGALVIDGKVELEKLREQAQNIE